MIGKIVCSLSGRDRGRFMVITGYADDFPLVCDGKHRRLAKPKRKNPKHIKPTNAFLTPKRLNSDSYIRKALKEYAQKDAAYQEGI